MPTADDKFFLLSNFKGFKRNLDKTGGLPLLHSQSRISATDRRFCSASALILNRRMTGFQLVYYIHCLLFAAQEIFITMKY